MTDDGTQARLFDAFAPSDYDAWYEAAVASLKGASFERKLLTQTDEGVTLQPIYNAADIAHLTHPHTLPGAAPYVRGTRSTAQSPDVAQRLPYLLPDALNAALKADLSRGQTAVNIALDTATATGQDADTAPPETVGDTGTSFTTAADFAAALKDVDLDNVPLYIEAGADVLSVPALLLAALKTRAKDIRGAIFADPSGTLAQRGTLPAAPDTLFDRLAELSRHMRDIAPQMRTVAVDTSHYADAGANAVQDTALLLATGAAYMRALLARGFSADDSAGQMLMVTAIGPNFFLEVARLRAARIVWAQMIAAFGGDDDAQKLHIHGRTTRLNQTRTDPYMNMLRATLSALAGTIAQVDSLHTDPFDAIAGAPDEFSRRIARNVSIILQEEAHLSRVTDAAGGAWFVEYLTDKIARESWGYFQQIEAAGGVLAALESGKIQADIDATRSERFNRLTTRKDVLVGTNQYASADDQLLPIADMSDERTQRAAAVVQYKQTRGALHVSDTSFTELIDAARVGATLGELSGALNAQHAAHTVKPLKQVRLSESFEALRAAAKRYEATNGDPPRIYCANVGALAIHKPRTDFTVAFFEVGGFSVEAADSHDTAEDAADAALASEAPVIVICSADEIYEDAVPIIAARIKDAQPDTIIILAGYPTDRVDDYRAAGVDDFIHLRANCYEMNAGLLRQLGAMS